VEVLEGLAAQVLKPVPQPAEGVTYAQKISKAEAHIRWSDAAAVIARQVRAFNPWPIAETRFAGEQLRIHDATARASLAAAPGKWLGFAGDALRVGCGSGELHVTQVQRAGRKVVSAREFAQSAGSAAGRFG
jgi:methionyl-tRNA formyltransferase